MPYWAAPACESGHIFHRRRDYDTDLWSLSRPPMGGRHMDKGSMGKMDKKPISASGNDIECSHSIHVVGHKRHGIRLLQQSDISFIGHTRILNSLCSSLS